MFNKKKKNNKGFTLVELLVVIAIIGILAVVAVPSLFKQVDKAKATQVVSNVKALKTEILTEYANGTSDSAMSTALDTTAISKVLELPATNKGKMQESYAVIDVDGDDKVAITITFAADAGGEDKADTVKQQIEGSTVADNVVTYIVGKK